MEVFRIPGEPGTRDQWTVLDDDFRVIEPIDQYLSFLETLERSPNTVEAYAYDLKLYWRFLIERGLSWDTVTVDEMGEFARWLRAPTPANVVALTPQPPARKATTVNRALGTTFAFYQFHQRHGVEVAEKLMTWKRGQSDYRSFLHHTTKGKRQPGRVVRLKEERRPPQRLTLKEVQQILDACTTLRDRLLMAVLFETGMRIGQALGLRHEDWRNYDRSVDITFREGNVNRARSKSKGTNMIPITKALGRLYSDYMHEEYGDLDCDYIFVNFGGPNPGSPMTYSSVNHLVVRLRKRTGIFFTPHMHRHTAASEWIAKGMSAPAVSRMLTHTSPTSIQPYLDLQPEELRAELIRSGFEEEE